MRYPIVFSLGILSTAVHVSPADSGRSVPVSPVQLPAATPLDVAEEQDPGLLEIARQFNPAMAFAIRDIWPVEVRYAWHEGSPLVARTEDGDGPAHEAAMVPGADLERVDWSRLPARTSDGRELRYYLDAPGDDRRDTPDGISRWRQRFRQIAQPGGDNAAPAASPYPPTQYVHAYWWNRAQGLLAIQYWFYYPFNEWVNHHEGDWEHIQIILKGASRVDADATWAPVGYHYFFHDFWTDATQVIRFAGDDPDEDHPLVYVGGQGEWFGHKGMQSGGSYPLPGRYPAAGFDVPWISPAEDTSRPQRFISAKEFRLILLPEPERLDAARSPELSWLRLRFYVGQRAVHENPIGVDGLCGRPPLQPAARTEWLGPARTLAWRGRVEPGRASREQYPWPETWNCAGAAQPGSCLTTVRPPVTRLQ